MKLPLSHEKTEAARAIAERPGAWPARLPHHPRQSRRRRPRQRGRAPAPPQGAGDHGGGHQPDRHTAPLRLPLRGARGRRPEPRGHQGAPPRRRDRRARYRRPRAPRHAGRHGAGPRRAGGVHRPPREPRRTPPRPALRGPRGGRHRRAGLRDRPRQRLAPDARGGAGALRGHHDRHRQLPLQQHPSAHPAGGRRAAGDGPRPGADVPRRVRQRPRGASPAATPRRCRRSWWRRSTGWRGSPCRRGRWSAWA